MNYKHSSKHFIILSSLFLLSVLLLVLFLTNSSLTRKTSESIISQTEDETSLEIESQTDVPSFLRRSFPATDFTDVDPSIEKILSGGPPKDGIPAIDTPRFETLQNFTRPDTVQAIVMSDGEEVKVYPYNILTWHEIVNDTVDGVPVAITFCPLCGSAIVFNREIEGEITTFGVSGALIESNMVMYDRATESLWQQSTGKALAGQHVGKRLKLVEFQLLSIGEIRKKYPNALVLSEDTGYSRDYKNNPYSGYEDDDARFAFGISEFDGRFRAKEIMVVFRVGETVFTTPWLSLNDGDEKIVSIGEKSVTLRKENGELTIFSGTEEGVPFYFEMWFSVAVQHGDTLVVIE